ncbi:MAG: RAMP superfamily protein [Syntrophorhabdaceae bacterium PtaU1.Bin034]|nr:MAG: RAMP superfamily protein [Syntrophorhabdaceae bacterium PtaU1.Bin034]
MQKPYRIRLHILSPVHIGCDDAYEPTGFVINTGKKQLIQFDPWDFLTSLSSENRDIFTRICSGDQLFPILKFIKQRFKPDIKGREIDISHGLATHYEKAMAGNTQVSNREVINQFTINRTVYNEVSQLPYISGSSLKGAMRTAYLNMRARMNKPDVEKSPKKAKLLEDRLAQGSFDTDPFRMVKISDLAPVADSIKTKVMYAVNARKDGSGARGPFQILETITQGTFDGILNITIPEKVSGIKTPITLDTLLRAVKDFYLKELERERIILKDSGFQGINVYPPTRNSLFPLRLGRHSGAEAVTVEGYRCIKIMQGKGKPSRYMDQPTTVWLASETAWLQKSNSLSPFGWAAIQVEPLDASQSFWPHIKLQEKVVPSSLVSSNKIDLPPAPIKPPDLMPWPGATVRWNPGNKKLLASWQDNKAEVTIGDDRSVVAEGLHKKLFIKKEPVKANVTVQPVGNGFAIVMVDFPQPYGEK